MPSPLLGLALAMTTIDLHGAPVQIPDPLVTTSGETVTSAEQWRDKRRPDLLELFRSQVYGRAPIERPTSLRFEITDRDAKAMEGKATRKKVTLFFKGPGGEGRLPLMLFVPNAQKGPASCFLLLNNRGPRVADPERERKSEFWPAEEIVARGYAAAVLNVADIDPDNDDGFKNGVHGIFDEPGKPRSGDAWATIGAWAWGASRALDYLEIDADIDAKHVAVIGHSRGGKTALWVGAQDERFALVISNDSGSTGAALARGKTGEDIAEINKTFPHWFATNYHAFGGKEAELPVDQHCLLALIAPRPLYVASATEDATADPEAEFASVRAAGPVYELLGHQGVGATKMPLADSPLVSGRIGYHLRTGKHDLTLYDWSRYMDFADKQFGRTKT